MDPLVQMHRNQRLVPNRDLSAAIVRFLNGRTRDAFPTSHQCYLVPMSDINGHVHDYLTLPGADTALSIMIDEWVFLGRKPSATRLWSSEYILCAHYAWWTQNEQI